MKIVLAQYWTDNLTYSKYTQAINEAYCKEKGYIYEVETDSNLIKGSIKDRSITWFKPKFILDTLEKHNPDFILFVDADAVVLNDNHSIEDFIIDGLDIVATEDYGPSKLNAGVLLIKNTAWSKDFLNKWWEICEEYPQYKTGLWHDQTCFGLLMDRTSDLTSHIKIINPNILNARAESKECFIFHAFAYGNIPCRTLDKVYYQKFNLPVPENYKDSLVDLAQFYGTDKHSVHNYISSVYSKVFLPIKDSVKLFVEVGVYQGASLKMWKDYFANARVIGVDINQSQVEGCEVIVCDQSNSEQLEVFKEVIQNADIILDDGSHKMFDQQKTLATLFKSLKPGGVFVLEDLHTSIECKMPDKAWCGWGDPDKTTTLDMLENFIVNKTIKSDYLNDEESKYLENNISDVKIYKVNPMSITSVIIKKEKVKTFIVYHCFLVKKWRELVKEQLDRLSSTGLLNKVDKLYCVVIDPDGQKEEFLNLISNYSNVEAEFQKNNDFEYPSILKVWTIAQQEDCKILYFHTKGVFNDYVDPKKDDISDLKIKTIRDWRKYMEYFCIDKWQENLNKLDEFDMVGSTCNSNWWWGNFWWATSKYLRTRPAPGQGSRWAYEAWSNENGMAKIYEHHHISFILYYTDYPEEFYKDGLYEKYLNSDITIHEALYGNNGIAIDEGWVNLDKPIYNDVTDILKQTVAKNGGKFIDITPGNDNLQGDPCWGIRKGLYIKYSFNVTPDKIYTLFTTESTRLIFPCFRKL